MLSRSVKKQSEQSGIRGSVGGIGSGGVSVVYPPDYGIDYVDKSPESGVADTAPVQRVKIQDKAEFVRADEKPKGGATGAIFKKKDDESGDKWLVKRGSAYGGLGGIVDGETENFAAIREVYGANLYKFFMSKTLADSNAAEYTLFKDEKDELSTGSKMIENFQDWKELEDEKPEFVPIGDVAPKTDYKKKFGKINGIGQALTAAYLIADVDWNEGNFGLISGENQFQFQKIDFGHVFSFNQAENHKSLSIENLAKFGQNVPIELIDENDVNDSLQKIKKIPYAELVDQAIDFEEALEDEKSRAASKEQRVIDYPGFGFLNTVAKRQKELAGKLRTTTANV